MKLRILMLMLMLTLSGCTGINWFLGIDDKGKDLEGPAPSEYVLNLMKSFGALGIAGAGAVSVGGAAYIARKRSQDPFESVVAAVQLYKQELEPDQKVNFVNFLKSKIPNRYHKAIGKIKDKL